MTEYAKKTCYECGRKLPQPQMKKISRSIEVGRSKRSLSGREVVGTLLGSEKSAKSVARWALAPNQRTYTRNQQVWICPECSGDAASERARAAREEQREKARITSAEDRAKKLELRRDQLKYGSIADEFRRIENENLSSYFFLLIVIGGIVWTTADNIKSQTYLQVALSFSAVMTLGYLIYLYSVKSGANGHLLKLAQLYEDRAASGTLTDATDSQEAYWNNYDFNLPASETTISKMALRPAALLPKQFLPNEYVSETSFSKGLMHSFASIALPNFINKKLFRGDLKVSKFGYTLNLCILMLVVAAATRPYSPFWSSLSPLAASLILSVCITTLVRRPIQVLSGNGIDQRGLLILKPKFSAYRILKRTEETPKTTSYVLGSAENAIINVDENLLEESSSLHKTMQDSSSKACPNSSDIPTFPTSDTNRSSALKLDHGNSVAEIACIQCGSTQLSARQRGFNWKIALPLGLVTGGLGLLIGFWGRKNIITTCVACVACGCTWKRKSKE